MSDERQTCREIAFVIACIEFARVFFFFMIPLDNGVNTRGQRVGRRRVRDTTVDFSASTAFNVKGVFLADPRTAVRTLTNEMSGVTILAPILEL